MLQHRFFPSITRSLGKISGDMVASSYTHSSDGCRDAAWPTCSSNANPTNERMSLIRRRKEGIRDWMIWGGRLSGREENPSPAVGEKAVDIVCCVRRGSAKSADTMPERASPPHPRCCFFGRWCPRDGLERR